MWLNDANGNYNPTVPLEARPEYCLQIFSERVQNWVNMSVFFEGVEDDGSLSDKSLAFSYRRDDVWVPETIKMEPINNDFFNKYEKVQTIRLYSSGCMYKLRAAHGIPFDETTEKEMHAMETILFNKRKRERETVDLTLQIPEENPKEEKKISTPITVKTPKFNKRKITEQGTAFSFLDFLCDPEKDADRHLLVIRSPANCIPPTPKFSPLHFLNLNSEKWDYQETEKDFFELFLK
jgi:hypothetical protein